LNFGIVLAIATEVSIQSSIKKQRVSIPFLFSYAKFLGTLAGKINVTAFLILGKCIFKHQTTKDIISLVFAMTTCKLSFH